MNNKGLPEKKQVVSPLPTKPLPLEKSDCCPSCEQGKIIRNVFMGGKREGESYIGCSRFPICFFYAGLH